MQLKTQDNLYGKGYRKLLNNSESNCQSQQFGTTSLLHALETGNGVTTCVNAHSSICCVHRVQKLSFRLVESGKVSYMMVAAYQQLSASAVASLCFCHMTERWEIFVEVKFFAIFAVELIV